MIRLIGWISLLCALSALVHCNAADARVAPESIVIAGLFPLTGRLSSGGLQREAAARIAVETINNDPIILPDTRLEMITFDTNTTQAGGLKGYFAALKQGAISLVGAASSTTSTAIATNAAIFGTPQLSYSSTAPALSGSEFPYFGRLVPPDQSQGLALAELVARFGWGQLTSGISTADDYGVSGVDQFLEAGAEIDVRLRSYQQFLVGSTDIDVEMQELAMSEARVFLLFSLSADARTVLRKAAARDLIGDTYVWICSDGCAQSSLFTNSEGEIISDVREAARGVIGLTPSGGTGPLFEEFLDDWETRDPEIYPGAGDRTINLFAPHAHDCISTFARAYDQLLREGGNITDPQVVIDTVASLQFTGLTGDITFQPNADRTAVYDVVNLRGNDDRFTVIGSWSAVRPVEDRFDFEQDVEFFDGTETIPDLDVQPPFRYWDCKAGRMRKDPTGKEVDRTTPDGDEPDFIASHYRCDQFIDCDNMSDEDLSCSPSFVATFISFGIITGMLVLVLPFFVVAVIAFGFVWKKRRIRLLSPVFLLGMCLATFVGYMSTFAWYGKPNKVACNFQPWLLGLSVNLMISFLFAKTYRIWRIFKSPFKPTKITDLQLTILVAILMVPAILLLICWTAFSTPTAVIDERDGEDHWVCDTGGLTGPPGGIIWFFILVGYTGFVLLFGVFLAFVTRNVPAEYSESKLVGYSVYNLAFVAAVVIPVYFVLRPASPVAAWIIRTVAILYGFTATLWMQMLPPLAMLAIHDKCAAIPPVNKDQMGTTGTQSMA